MFSTVAVVSSKTSVHFWTPGLKRKEINLETNLRGSSWLASVLSNQTVVPAGAPSRCFYTPGYSHDLLQQLFPDALAPSAQLILFCCLPCAAKITPESKGTGIFLFFAIYSGAHRENGVRDYVT